MTKAPAKRLRQLLTAIWQQLTQLIHTLSGKDRREKRRLFKHLSTLKAEHNLLQRDMAELRHLSSLEIRGLQAIGKQVENERDDLQLQVWELEQQIAQLLNYIAQVEQHHGKTSGSQSGETSATGDNPSPITLSTVYLGLVGGHPTTRQAVIEELSTHYGLKRWVEIPPLREAKIRKSRLKRKLQNCTLIVIIADYMSHPLTHAINGLKAAGALIGEVVLLNCHGKSGVIRDILAHIEGQKIEK
jgi:hypothetical protein